MLLTDEENENCVEFEEQYKQRQCCIDLKGYVKLCTDREVACRCPAGDSVQAGVCSESETETTTYLYNNLERIMIRIGALPIKKTTILISISCQSFCAMHA